MQYPAVWDSKDLLRRDILTNPHLHLNIKERLLKGFEKADWARWHDSFFCKCIMGGELPTALRTQIEQCPYLTVESRDNLLLNLTLREEQ
jgi:hypothetical protein